MGFVNPISGFYPVDFDSNKVYDMESMKKTIITVSSILGFDILCFIVFAGILNWI